MKITIPKWIIQLKENLTKSKLDSTLNKLSKNPKSKEFVSMVKKKLNATYKHSSSSSNPILSIISAIVGLAVTLSVGLLVLGQLQKSASVSSIGPITGIAYNATGPVGSATQNLLTTLPNWIGIIITVTMAFIVLGYFYNK